MNNIFRLGNLYNEDLDIIYYYIYFTLKFYFLKSNLYRYIFFFKGIIKVIVKCLKIILVERIKILIIVEKWIDLRWWGIVVKKSKIKNKNLKY